MSGSPYKTSFRYNRTELIPDVVLIVAFIFALGDFNVEFIPEGLDHVITGAVGIATEIESLLLEATGIVKYRFSDVVEPMLFAATRYIVLLPGSKFTDLLTR